MGAGSTLRTSPFKASIFIGKLHAAVAEYRAAYSFSGNVYPFVDGVYITTEKLHEIQSIVKSIMKQLALVFLFEENFEYQFMVRSSLAFGKVIEAANIEQASEALRKDSVYTSGILFGAPLVSAYQSEKMASPFGVWIDESARHFSPEGKDALSRTFWSWWIWPSYNESIDQHCDEIERLLAGRLKEYLNWCSRNSHSILYDEAAIERHQKIASQYFPSWDVT